MMRMGKTHKYQAMNHGFTWMIRAYTMTRVRAIGFYFLVATKAQTPLVFHPNAKGKLVS